MHVIATAGHVDHGKSALVRALTGMEPDRWEQEIRRGMTIDLGYAWTTLPSGEEVAFVDVPGHQRFTTNMLAGVGPVPAALVVVAADGGWSAQTVEHVAALDALGVGHGLLAVSRSDLADPGPVIDDAGRRLAATTLGRVEAVATSAVTGAGLDDLRAALDRLVASLPAPRAVGRIRLWVDRAFRINGFGTVLTGTLGAGTLSEGDVLELAGERVVVRGLESLGRPAPSVAAVARVAVNLRAAPSASVARGAALLTPGAWSPTDVVDVRLLAPTERLPRQLVVHVGSAAVPVEVRRLGDGDDGVLVRLSLHRPLPLEVGDRLLLRDPGLHRLVAGAVVLDPAPPRLRGRGAAAARAGALASAGGVADVAGEVRRRGVVDVDFLERIGVPAGGAGSGDRPVPDGVRRVGRWLVAAEWWEEARSALVALVSAPAPAGQLVDAGVASDDAVRRLGLPASEMLGPLVASVDGVEEAGGRVRRAGRGPQLAPHITRALRPLLDALAAEPFAAPPANDLAAAGLSSRDLAAAAAAGAVVLLPGDVVLGPDADSKAVAVLDGIPAPFTVSEARVALATSRRVAVPLLQRLDRAGLTRRVEGDRRVRTGRRPAP